MRLLDRYWSTACCRGGRDEAKPVGRVAVALTVREYQTAATAWILLVGVYTVAAWCDARDRAIGVVAIVTGLTIVAIVGLPGGNSADVVFNFVIYAAAYLFGSTMRNRRLYSEQLEARAKAQG